MSESLLFDIGGTWIKSVVANADGSRSGVIKSASPLREDGSPEELARVLIDLGQQQTSTPVSIVVATAGVVNYHGNAMERCAPHLAPLLDPVWITSLREYFNCPVTLVNDGDCALIGAAESGLLTGARSVGLMVIGTGLGFCVWKNGRRWRPGRKYTLLGAVHVGDRNGDQVASASRLAAQAPDGDLVRVLRDAEFAGVRQAYFQDLARLIESAVTLYQLDEVALSGGLVDAAKAAGFDVRNALLSALNDPPDALSVFQAGNDLQLRGAHALAKAEAVAEKARFRASYGALKTEQPHDPTLRLETMSAEELVHALFVAEQEAGARLLNQHAVIARAAEALAERLRRGGRLIYVGCGSSGRIAALDAVELPCTFGLSEDRAICLIAGGVTEAAMDVEHRFEEDASAVPELLLLSPGEQDVVVGISASGSAYYVRSALAASRDRGALAILVSTAEPKEDFCDLHLPLCSGGEVLSGSTRMKAGTATKKILNALSTTAMILLGKARGARMVDLSCVNEKLQFRARGVLQELFGCDEATAEQVLLDHDHQLLAAIEQLEQEKNGEVDGANAPSTY